MVSPTQVHECAAVPQSLRAVDAQSPQLSPPLNTLLASARSRRISKCQPNYALQKGHRIITRIYLTLIAILSSRKLWKERKTR
jgi:hypothetical protein